MVNACSRENICNFWALNVLCIVLLVVYHTKQLVCYVVHHYALDEQLCVCCIKITWIMLWNFPRSKTHAHVRGCCGQLQPYCQCAHTVSDLFRQDAHVRSAWDNSVHAYDPTEIPKYATKGWQDVRFANHNQITDVLVVYHGCSFNVMPTWHYT